MLLFSSSFIGFPNDNCYFGGFCSQFTSLEADKIRLQKEVESTSSKLDNAVKIATEARQNADSLKEELKQLKSKLKDEEALMVAAEAQRNEKDNLLYQFTLSLLSSPR
jgi:chromosome segregation ATPase